MRNLVGQTLGTALLISALAPGCMQGSDDPVAQGRAVYAANCTACHNPDPTRDGNLGPALAGSPRPLLEARILRAEYPPGYTPKRDSNIMLALPYLKGEIDFIAAYLADVASD